MLRYLPILLVFLSTISIANQPAVQIDPQIHYDWDCWGWKNTQMKVKDRNGNNQTLFFHTDVCDRKKARPLTVDVYLHNIFFSGSHDSTDVDVVVKATHKLTGKMQTLIKGSKATGPNASEESVQRFEFSAIRSGEYDIELYQIWITFRKSGLPVGSYQLRNEIQRYGVGNIEGANPAAMWYMIKNAKSNTLKSGEPSHIVFGHQYEVPMNTGKGSYTMATSGNLLIVPLMSEKSPNIIPHLLGDTHKGEAARCEGMPNARTTDGTLEQAELYSPQQAWLKLDRPLVAFNANYFDVREQMNGTTWKSNLCSVPLGIYYDNDTSGPTGGTHNFPNKYFPGPEYFISDDNSKVALDSLFWIQDFNSTLEINYSHSPTDPAIEQRAKQLDQNGFKFLAIAGSGIPNRALTPEPAPDSGESDTTRLIIAPDNKDNVLYIFEGGGYRDGINRDDLYWLTYGLGLPHALELDGGGSAALALDSNAFILSGDSRPSSSCNTSGLWCSAITQPDGQHRPVPSWIGLSLP